MLRGLRRGRASGRRLTEAEAAAVRAAAAPIDRPAGTRRIALPISGIGLDGDVAVLPVARLAVLLLVAPGCDGCADLVALVRAGDVDGEVVAGVVRSPSGGLPDPVLDELAGGRGVWLVADALYDELGVRKGPYCCVVGDDGEVLAEGLPFGTHDVVHALRSARRATGR